MDNKYDQGKIYKICDVGYTKSYYGSTIESLSKRIARHRFCYRSYKEGKGYAVSVYNIFDEFY